MKKIILMAVCFAALCSCNSNENGQGTTSSDTSATNQAGMQNVNGNIPDTTNSISIGSDGKGTSSQHKDSAHKR